LRDPKFRRFDRTTTCDRRTDEQTDSQMDKDRATARTALA